MNEFDIPVIDDDPDLEAVEAVEIEDDTAEFDPQHMQDIQGLLFLGYLEDSFEFLGHDFTLRTLRSGEELICAQIIKEYSDTLGVEKAFAMAYVAASIVLLDSRPLVAEIGTDRDQTLIRIQRSFNRVREWFWPVVEYLYERYAGLVVKQAQAFKELEGKSSASRPQP